MTNQNDPKTIKEKAILEQLAATGLEAMHYYDHGISVTLLLANTSDFLDGDKGRVVMARGIAICSATDQFSKKEGRLISLGRALKAYRSQSSSKEVLPRWTDKLSANPLVGAVVMFGKPGGNVGVYERVYKSRWMPELTEKEQALIKNRRQSEATA